MLIAYSLRQRPVRRLGGECVEMGTVDDTAVCDLLVAQDAREALVAIRRSGLHDATDQMLVARAGVDGHFEDGAQRHAAPVEQELLTIELRADLPGVVGLQWIAALHEDRLLRAQQLGLAQVVEQREQTPQGNAE